MCFFKQLGPIFYLKYFNLWGAWPAQLVEYVTLDLGVVSLSFTLGLDLTYKKKPNISTCKNKSFL